MAIVEVGTELLERQRNCANELRNFYARRKVSLGREMTYHILTYGCQSNEADSEKLAGVLEDIGFKPSEDNDCVDIIILNTCAIRENAVDRLFGNLGIWKNKKISNKDMLVAVCGCMMKQEGNVPKILKSYRFVDMIFGPQDIFRLPELLYDRVIKGKKVLSVSEDDYLFEDLDSSISRKRKYRALVPIIYGCDNFCSYCVVPYARGRERSRSFDSIMRQLEKLSAEGFKEVLLVGQNVNSYGRKKPNSQDFPSLLESIASRNLFFRIRFMTSHPKDISERLIEVMAKYPCIERHLHLPFQSGSNAVLEKMNRKYTRETYLKTVETYRRLVPEGSLTTDIIVGFPGETEEDFSDTLSLMEAVRFDSAFTFQYSPRLGTKAYDDPNPVSADVITERFNRLVEMQNAHSLASNTKAVGSLQTVLIEGLSHTSDDIYTGRASDHRLINFTIPNELIEESALQVLISEGIITKTFEGMVAAVRITGAKTFSVEGVLERFIYE